MATKKRLPDAADQVRRWDWSDLPAEDISLRDLLMWDREMKKRKRRREMWLRVYGCVLWLALAVMALLIADGLAGLVAG
ncbi:MAG: hypothetical protein OXU22_00455 [Gammaproteobacteria bacterium]|nr:hypothetical protein [Gammaproteobacteria bacterium]